jgi:hypothetical protein
MPLQHAPTRAISPIRFLVPALLAVMAGASTGHALEFDREFGEASFKFLKLPLSPRVVALGGSGVALADGAGEIDLNPAAPAADSGHLVLGKGYPFAEFQANTSHITWSIPYRGYRILLNARYLGFDDIPGFTPQNGATSDYGAHTLKAQAGLAGGFHRLMWGATVGFANNNIANASYSSAMVNAGARYAVLPGLMAGLSVVNADFWDSKAKEEGNRDPFPPTAAQAGLSYTHALWADLEGSAAVDARTRNDEKMVWPMGLEVSWRKILFARAGYPLGEQEPAVAMGMGLQWSLFRFQYAFQNHETLSPAHYWSLDIHY